jgi:hypothetical protein
MQSPRQPTHQQMSHMVRCLVQQDLPLTQDLLLVLCLDLSTSLELDNPVCLHQHMSEDSNGHVGRNESHGFESLANGATTSMAARVAQPAKDGYEQDHNLSQSAVLVCWDRHTASNCAEQMNSAGDMD